MATETAPPKTLSLEEIREKYRNYVPPPRKHVDWAAVEEATRHLQEQMDAMGITEDDINEDIKAIKAGRSR